MTFLVVAVPIFGIATNTTETCTFLYPTALSGLITAFKHGYNWNRTQFKIKEYIFRFLNVYIGNANIIYYILYKCLKYSFKYNQHNMLKL